MTDCIFCRIVAGEAEASFIHRDDPVSAFLDINPVRPGHLLVIPNEHVVFTHDLPDATADRLFAVARRLTHAPPSHKELDRHAHRLRAALDLHDDR